MDSCFKTISLLSMYNTSCLPPFHINLEKENNYSHFNKSFLPRCLLPTLITENRECFTAYIVFLSFSFYMAVPVYAGILAEAKKVPATKPVRPGEHGQNIIVSHGISSTLKRGLS
eukprot:1155186-Pelagomonas_calceolata.AAC.4